jgi:phosphatidylinositol alpha-mannosyltransferase
VRVGLVCPYSWSVPGGVQSHVAGLARALGGLGVDTEVLAPVDGSANGVLPLGRSVPIPSNGSVQRVALSPAAVARTARAVRGRGYDVVHVHEPMLPAAGLTAIAASRVPVVATFHMYRRALLWYGVFAPVVRAAARRVDAFLAVSPAAAEYARRGTGRELEIVPNGIDYDAFASLEPERRGNRILFIGRDEPRKGLKVLRAAHARLRRPAELVLVGPSGFVSDTELRRELGRADVLVAPSLGGESFGVVLVEAMAAGVPVVASDIAGYREVLPESAGVLVPPGDIGALAHALDGLLQDDGRRAQLGASGCREAEQYAWPRIAERTLAVYERVLGQKGSDLVAERPGRTPFA